MTYSQAPVVCEKNILHLFCSTQPVENYTYSPFLQDIYQINSGSYKTIVLILFINYMYLLITIRQY